MTSPASSTDRRAPAARRDPTSGYTVHGERFDDPYLWLERLDDPETESWLAAQEAVAHAALRAVPGRDALRAAVTQSARHAPRSAPISSRNGCEFVWKADEGDEKLALMVRRGEHAPLDAVLDPNTWASDEVLVFAVPSPDGTMIAFGKAIGSNHDARIHVLDVGTGRLLPDRPNSGRGAPDARSSRPRSY
jgi:prolyl oligopeptidase